MLLTLAAGAKVDIDYSSRFEEGTNTIRCAEAWGWHSVMLGSTYQVAEAEYLYIQYEASCNFNLILQDQNWQNCYAATCSADAKEAYIKLTPGAYPEYSCVVIQNHAEGEITIKKIYFCSEEEFFNPAPDDPDEARQNLVDIYMRYQPLLDTFPLGTDYGQYPVELYQAFVEAMNAALILDTDEGRDLTVEQLNAMSQKIVDSYKALLAGKRLYLPADGYYRFVCARQFSEGDDEIGWTPVAKAMYSDNTGANQWKDIDREDPAFLWTLTRQPDNSYLLRNASNNLVMTSAERSTDQEKFIAIDAVPKVDGAYQLSWPVSTEDSVVIFNFRFSTDAANDYKYIHMNWHNGGTGWGGPMTLWCNTTNDSGASEWYLEPVDESVAEELLNANNYGFKFAQMLADAKAKSAIANDMIRERLITEATQFSSPFSQNDLGNRDGGNLSEGVLLDNDKGTYWHSYWEGGNAESGSHYLQVEMPEEISGELEFTFSRRMWASDDHVTQWGVYGANQFSGEKYDYEWIADLETPYGSNDETLTARFTIEEGKQYQYLRFYAESTTSGRGYWHVSEFQLYSLSENPTNQARNMGDVYTRLVEAIAKAETVDANAVSKTDYDALKAAYDPFIEMFVDPTPLRQALDVAEPAIELCDIGTNPGQWSQENYDACLKLIEEARAYDQAGKYTQAQTDAYVAQLGDGKSMVLAAANKVSPDKFYTLRFASEDLYVEQGWSTSNVVSEEWGDLYDTYLCAADAETLETMPATDIRQGSYIFFTTDSKADIAFRFVPVGDGKFIIQHQASGLFIHCYGRNSWTGLTLTPTFFTVEAVGHGENIIRATDYAGKDLACLHAQLNNHRLVTWQDDYAGCNSALIIEEVDVDATIGQPLADYQAGEITTMCYPISVQPRVGTLYTVAGTYAAEEKTYVALNKVDKADAGQPVVYVAEGTFDAENKADVQTVSLTIGTDVVLEPMNQGALQGTYEDLDLEQSAIIFDGNKCEMSTEEKARVWANHAYVVPGMAEADAQAKYDLVLEVGSEFTGIADVVKRLSERGDLYNAAGQLLRRNATLNEVHAQPRGLYILNGIKILVK